ncbi:MAG: hypothetical protein FWD61_01020 [Phycisphaerales bacterium]|nr:hypothetical protein [Phycisphaerales bacterium]
MFQKLKTWIMAMGVIGVVLCTTTRLSFAADASTPIFTQGWYNCSEEGPDAMTATASSPIEAKGGFGIPDDPDDTILIDGIGGTTVYFSGRSAENGCYYLTWGIFLGGGSEVGSDGKNEWEAYFSNEECAYFVIYINSPTTIEDDIFYCNPSQAPLPSTITVELHNYTGDESIQFMLSVSGDGEVHFIDSPSQSISNGASVDVHASGTDSGPVGKVTITVTAY